MVETDLFFFFALIASSFAFYTWGHLKGFKEGSRKALGNNMKTAASSAFEVMKLIGIKDEDIVRATFDICVKDIQKTTGIDQESAKKIAESFLNAP